MDNVGAWYLGGYRKGDQGTLGESLDLDSRDTIGWAIRSWKYELVYNGLHGGMILNTPVFGDAMRTQVRAFQSGMGTMTVDGVIGPKTAAKLLERRLGDLAGSWGVPLRDLRGIVRAESGFDIGAIGVADHADRGPTQYHITDAGSVNLSQAVRPAAALPRLAAQLLRIGNTHDEDTAVVSWNIGEGGADWWFDHGKPAEGSPDWWHGGVDMSARATAYLQMVRGAT